MSDKCECPGCDSYTSSILQAFTNGDPCPYCGLSQAAADEITQVRTTKADAQLRARLEEALLRADRAEAVLVEAYRFRDAIVSAVEREMFKAGCDYERGSVA